MLRDSPLLSYYGNESPLDSSVGLLQAEMKERVGQSMTRSKLVPVVGAYGEARRSRRFTCRQFEVAGFGRGLGLVCL